MASGDLLGRRIPITGGSLTPAHAGEQAADIIADPRYRSGAADGVTIEDVPVGLDT